MRHLISLHLLQFLKVLRLMHHLFQHHESWYRVTYIVHRDSTPKTISIPSNSYYYELLEDYPEYENYPSLYFYEGDQAILQLNVYCDKLSYSIAAVITSSLITQFVFT